MWSLEVFKIFGVARARGWPGAASGRARRQWSIGSVRWPRRGTRDEWEASTERASKGHWTSAVDFFPVGMSISAQGTLSYRQPRRHITLAQTRGLASRSHSPSRRRRRIPPRPRVEIPSDFQISWRSAVSACVKNLQSVRQSKDGGWPGGGRRGRRAAPILG